MFHLSPVTLPLPALDPDLSPIDPSELASQLAGLAYPGFAYVPNPSQPRNPGTVVTAVLVDSDLDQSLVEALPWVLATFPDLNWHWLIAQCRLTNQQNRLGYLVLLAQQLTQPLVPPTLVDALAQLESSRPAKESTLCRESMPTAERARVRQHRPPWLRNGISLAADQLTHAA